MPVACCLGPGSRGWACRRCPLAHTDRRKNSPADTRTGRVRLRWETRAHACKDRKGRVVETGQTAGCWEPASCQRGHAVQPVPRLCSFSPAMGPAGSSAREAGRRAGGAQTACGAVGWLQCVTVTQTWDGTVDSRRHQGPHGAVVRVLEGGTTPQSASYPPSCRGARSGRQRQCSVRCDILALTTLQGTPAPRTLSPLQSRTARWPQLCSLLGVHTGGEEPN